MIKKFAVFMTIFCLFISCKVSASEITEYEEYQNVIEQIAPCIFNDANENITRGDCIVSIMTLIGVDEKAAEHYANCLYHTPIFYDIGYDKVEEGYIIAAKFANVANGVNVDRTGVGNFEPNRTVTVKECLTFMLRCLIDSELVSWDNIMEDSVKIGLLQENELNFYIADEPIQNNQFYIFLSRMLEQNRYLYWPEDEPLGGHGNSMQTDTSRSITYLDFLAV